MVASVISSSCSEYFHLVLASADSDFSAIEEEAEFSPCCEFPPTQLLMASIEAIIKKSVNTFDFIEAYIVMNKLFYAANLMIKKKSMIPAFLSVSGNLYLYPRQLIIMTFTSKV